MSFTFVCLLGALIAHLFSRNRVICNYLETLNKGFDTWDDTFVSQGKTAEAEVFTYCRAYGVQMPNIMPKPAPDTSTEISKQCDWDWSKFPHEYTTMNDWFTRQYRKDLDPSLERNTGDALVLAPATAGVV